MTDVTPAGDLTDANRTSYLHSHRHWFCRQPHDWHHPTLDPIFYRFERGDRPFRQDTIGPLRWRGNIVLNNNNLCVDQHIFFATCDTLTVNIIGSSQTTLICHSPYHPRSYVDFGFFHLHVLLLKSASIKAKHTVLTPNVNRKDGGWKPSCGLMIASPLKISGTVCRVGRMDSHLVSTFLGL